MSGGSDEPAATTRPMHTGEWNGPAGSTTTASSSVVGRVKGATGPVSTPAGQRGTGSCRTAKSLAFRRLPLPQRPGGLVVRMNYAFQSAGTVQRSPGLQPFGCLKPSAPMPQVGEVFSC